jgi:hypothetical protein
MASFWLTTGLLLMFFTSSILAAEKTAGVSILYE